jgi:hypothetical protein
MNTTHRRLLLTFGVWGMTLISAWGQPVPPTSEQTTPLLVEETANELRAPRPVTSQSITGGETLSHSERIVWAVESSVGPKSLGAGVLSAAWGVSRDSPDEYGANWRGFGKRYALRLSGVSISNSIEAAAGALWDEDPRYSRAGSGSVWGRMAHAGKRTFLAGRADGRLRPAYARGLGIVGNNFITNAWRAHSDRSIADALSRSGVGVTSRFVSNLFDEFWPDIQRELRPGAK